MGVGGCGCCTLPKSRWVKNLMFTNGDCLVLRLPTFMWRGRLGTGLHVINHEGRVDSKSEMKLSSVTEYKLCLSLQPVAMKITQL